MTPERWREVDGVLQAALASEPAQRNAVIAEACGADEALRLEVGSLLLAHVGDADTFLERPPDRSLVAAFDAHDAREPNVLADRDGAPHALRSASIGRTISARVALYAAGVTLVAGLVGGIVVDRAYFLRNGSGGAPLPGTTNHGDAPMGEAVPLVVVDRTGRLLHTISGVRPWTPRFSPDGRAVAYGAFGGGRETSDLWVSDLDAGTTRRLTDDGADANDPQWSSDGARLAYSAGPQGGKDVMVRSLAAGSAQRVAARAGSQFPTDWSHDGRTLLVTDESGSGQHDILAQPMDGAAARPYLATSADETAARFSPDGRWVAYTSTASGRAEVYVDSWPTPGRRVLLSSGGGVHPVWRGDGRELYYWRDGALVAVQLDAAVGDTPPVRRGETVLFQAPYAMSVNTMYDVSPDGQRFVIVRASGPR